MLINDRFEIIQSVPDAADHSLIMADRFGYACAKRPA
jgi:hypothetical protein